MAHIRVIPPDEAEGTLRRLYEAAIARAGRVYHIVRLQGANPGVLDASIGLYRAIMHGASPLSRAQREMIAVVVSRADGCLY